MQGLENPESGQDVPNYNHYETLDEGKLEEQRVAVGIYTGKRESKNNIAKYLFLLNVAVFLGLSIFFISNNSLENLSGGPEFPFGLMCLVSFLTIIAAICFIYALKYIATMAVWFMLILRPVVVLALWAFTRDLGIRETILDIIVLIYVCYVVIYLRLDKKSINTACEIVRVASKSIIAKPSMLILGISMAVLYLCIAFLYMYSIANGVHHKDAGDLMKVYLVSFTWLVFTMDSIKLYTLTVPSASWYFNVLQDQNPTKLGLIWALTTGLGANAIGGFICAIVDALRKRSKKSLANCWNPVYCVIMILASILLRFVEAASRFCTCVCAITGLSFWTSAKVTAGSLKRNLRKAYGMAIVRDWVIKPSAILVSMITWVTILGATPANEGGFDFSETMQAQIAVIVGTVWAAFTVSYPMLSMLTWSIVYTFSDTAVLMACFIGSVVYIIFLYMANILGDVSTAVLTCYCLDKDGNAQSEHTKEIDGNILPNMNESHDQSQIGIFTRITTRG